MLSIKEYIFIALITTALAEKWASMCDGEMENNIRGCDMKGCGYYGASRGKRTHKGVDVACTDGSVINSPFTGKIMGQAKPYKNENAINDGVWIRGSDSCVKMFYVKPDKYRGTIKKGEKLGILMPMQKVYPSITSHIHIQNCDLSDPTPLL